MDNVCKWLPDMFDDPDWSKFVEYFNELYVIFKSTYLINDIYFRGKIVKLRYLPIVDGKEESFYHLTCKNYTKIETRKPDPNRFKRLLWAKAFIINYLCKEDCCKEEEKPLIWKVEKFNKYRKYYIYYMDYLVILEEREDYFLLITGFYVEDDYYHYDLIDQSQKTENAIC